MSGPTLVALVAALWFATGLFLSLAMGRRGHDGYAWLVLGTILGPLALAIALDARMHGEELQPEVIADAHGGHSGVDVLIGIDGSVHARHAVRRAAALFGPHLGRLTFAAVVPFDAPAEAVAKAKENLERAAAFVPGYAQVAPALEVVHGHPATALQRLAREDAYDVLVVGTRGTGMSKRLVGSAASELARATDVPVLLVNSDPTPNDPTAAAPMTRNEAANAIAVTAWAQRARST